MLLVMDSKWVVVGLLGLAWGCGPAVTLDDASGSGSEDSTGSTSSNPMTTAATGTGDDDDDDDDDDADTTVGPSDTTGPDDPSTSTGESTESGEESSTGEPVMCDPPDAVAALPNIWVANASEGTVSRIDTETVAETGRFIVRPDSAGSPSRTSVAFNGDMAVANRLGGVTKIYANEADCQDTNGTPGIQTSTDSTPLAWGEEECIAWHTPFDYVSNRPIAWTPGELNEEACAFEGSNVWTSGTTGPGAGADVLLLDGETGVVMQTVVIPEVSSSIGLYGGAVDGEGNFWGVETSLALYRVDADDYSVERWGFNEAPVVLPGYGITVDAQGRPLTCASGHAARFDEGGASWQTTPNAQAGIGGCATDGLGTLWHSDYNTTELYAIDVESMTVMQTFPIPEYFHGVSVDFDGMVWGVPIGGSSVYRVDPSTGNVDELPGFVGLYTYSDMTGLALAAVSGYVEP